MRGPKAKSNHLRIVEGNPGERKILPHYEAEGELHDPPEWFQPNQRLMWDRVIRDSKGCLKEIHFPLVTAYVCAICEHAENAQQLFTHGGSVVLSPVKGIPMQSPYLSAMNKQTLLIAKYAEMLGLSPTSQSRLKVPNAKAKSSSTFANLKKLQIEEEEQRRK